MENEEGVHAWIVSPKSSWVFCFLGGGVVFNHHTAIQLKEIYPIRRNDMPVSIIFTNSKIHSTRSATKGQEFLSFIHCSNSRTYKRSA